MDKTKLVKILRLMKLLTGNVNQTVFQLAEELDTTPRSIYRYIDDIRDAGFVVNKLYGNVFQMGKMARGLSDFNKLIYFTEEEAFIINRLINSLDNNHALKRDIQRKLASVYDSTSIANYIDKTANASNIEALSQAISSHKQVVLKKYESANSDDIRDRLVEPFAFTSNMIDVWAYDVDEKQNKVFKIMRISDVQVLEQEWEFKDDHKEHTPDIFRLTGDKQYTVVLLLNTRAKNLLLEEYPLAEKDLCREDGKWYLKTKVNQLEGVGRFVLGLAADIEIVEGEDLKDYIKKYDKRFIQKIK